MGGFAIFIFIFIFSPRGGEKIYTTLPLTILKNFQIKWIN